MAPVVYFRVTAVAEPGLYLQGRNVVPGEVVTYELGQCDQEWADSFRAMVEEKQRVTDVRLERQIVSDWEVCP